MRDGRIKQKCTGCIEKKRPKLRFGSFLWCWTELNCRHTDFQSVALPTELQHRSLFEGAKVQLFFELSALKRKKSIKKFIFLYLRHLQLKHPAVLSPLSFVLCPFLPHQHHRSGFSQF